MSDPARANQLAQEQKVFVVAFIIGLPFFGFFLLFVGTFAGLWILELIISEPILYVFSVIFFSLGYATIRWRNEIKLSQKQEGKC